MHTVPDRRGKSMLCFHLFCVVYSSPHSAKRRFPRHRGFSGSIHFFCTHFTVVEKKPVRKGGKVYGPFPRFPSGNLWEGWENLRVFPRFPQEMPKENRRHLRVRSGNTNRGWARQTARKAGPAAGPSPNAAAARFWAALATAQSGKDDSGPEAAEEGLRPRA